MTTPKIPDTVTMVGFDGGKGDGDQFVLFRPVLMLPDKAEPVTAPWHALPRQGARELIKFLSAELERLDAAGPAVPISKQ